SFALNSNPAQLKSRLQAADAGRPVLSFRVSFLICLKAFSRSILTDTQARYPSISPVPSDLLDFIEENKSSSSDECCPTCSSLQHLVKVLSDIDLTCRMTNNISDNSQL